MEKIEVTLKRIREQKHLTQTELSEKMEISQSVYARIESGKIKLRFDILEKFAEVVNMSVIEVLAFPDVINSVDKDFISANCQNKGECELFKTLKKENELLKIKMELVKDNLIEKNEEIKFLRELLLKNNIKN